MQRAAWLLLLSAALLGMTACAKDRGTVSRVPVSTAVLPPLDPTDRTVAAPILEEHVGFAQLSDGALGQRINDPRAQAELSKRFQQTQPMRLVMADGQLALQGVGDFERRQELFLRLVDVFFLNHDQLTGASKDQVEAVFGPGAPDPTASSMTDRYIWDAGRDLLVMEYQNQRVVFAAFLSE